MPNYTLKCLKTDDEFNDDYTLHYNDGALIQAEYKKEFQPLGIKGVWRYFDWLPTEEISSQVAGTATYHAKELGEHLGFSNLWIAFHGYWPEKEGLCPTGSFKDMEAVPENTENERSFVQRDDLCIGRQYSKGIYTLLCRR